VLVVRGVVASRGGWVGGGGGDIDRGRRASVGRASAETPNRVCIVRWWGPYLD